METGKLRALAQANKRITEELSAEAEREQRAKADLVTSAHRFSSRTRAVVDDKLTFSLTLMRAGEEEAARRLLAEVEQQVREEEAALLEVVNEAAVAHSMRRSRQGRLLVARTLVAAMLGAALMAFPAVGMAVARVLDGAFAPEDSGDDSSLNLAPHTDGFSLGSSLAAATRSSSDDRGPSALTEDEYLELMSLAGEHPNPDLLDELGRVVPERVVEQLKGLVHTTDGLATTAARQVQESRDEVQSRNPNTREEEQDGSGGSAAGGGGGSKGDDSGDSSGSADHPIDEIANQVFGSDEPDDGS